MDDLLRELRRQLHDLAAAGEGLDDRKFEALEDKLLERVQAELVKSFKNGLMRGRELATGEPEGRTRGNRRGSDLTR
jgi:hypothetical protein